MERYSIGEVLYIKLPVSFTQSYNTSFPFPSWSRKKELLVAICGATVVVRNLRGVFSLSRGA